jgi:hypothetical protein
MLKIISSKGTSQIAVVTASACGYANDANPLGENPDTIKETKKVPTDDNWEIGL